MENEIKKGGRVQIKIGINYQPWRELDAPLLKDGPEQVVLFDDLIELFWGMPSENPIKRKMAQTQIRKAVHEWNVANGEEDED